jgi:putative cell wall-binding protein
VSNPYQAHHFIFLCFFINLISMPGIVVMALTLVLLTGIHAKTQALNESQMEFKIAQEIVKEHTHQIQQTQQQIQHHHESIIQQVMQTVSSIIEGIIELFR